MQIVRTVLWVVILFGLLIFSFFNWNPVEVTLWSNLVLETRVPALVVISFLLGLLPMWLVHRGTKWRLGRRISTLEQAARANALARHEPTSRADTDASSPSPPVQDQSTPQPTQTPPDQP